MAGREGETVRRSQLRSQVCASEIAVNNLELTLHLQNKCQSRESFTARAHTRARWESRTHFRCGKTMQSREREGNKFASPSASASLSSDDLRRARTSHGSNVHNAPVRHHSSAGKRSYLIDRDRQHSFFPMGLVLHLLERQKNRSMRCDAASDVRTCDIRGSKTIDALANRSRAHARKHATAGVRRVPIVLAFAHVIVMIEFEQVVAAEGLLVHGERRG